jgi:hypothetical protein
VQARTSSSSVSRSGSARSRRLQPRHRASLRLLEPPEPTRQYAYYGKVGGCLITGNEDGIKHCSMNILYSLQHLGYTIPPQADAGWIGEAGRAVVSRRGSGGPENDFTNRNTTFMTWNLLHAARMLKDAGGVPAHGNPAVALGCGLQVRLREPGLPLARRASCFEKKVRAAFVFVSWRPFRLIPFSVRNKRASAETWNASAAVHFVDSSRIRDPSG